MIFFCEDCGKKNILKSRQIVGGFAGFRCSACNYPNSYPVAPPRERSPAPHSAPGPANPPEGGLKVLKGINLFPGVIGSFVYDLDTGIGSRAVPEILGERELATFGEILAKNFHAGRHGYPDITESTLVFRKKALIARHIAGKRFIAVMTRTFPMPPKFKGLLDQAVERLGAFAGTPKASFPS